MHSVPDLIDEFGGPTKFSKVVGKRASTASEMRRSKSIPVGYWPKIIAAAAKQGIKGVTPELLMKIHHVEAPLVSPREGELA